MDETSKAPVVDIEMPLEQVGEIFFGCADNPIQYQLFDCADKIGKIKETKPLVFEVSGFRQVDEAISKAKKLVEPGWKVLLYFEEEN